MSNPLFQSYLRVAMANKHFSDMEAILDKWLEEFRVSLFEGVELNPKTFRPDTSKIDTDWHRLYHPPEMIYVYAGEVIQNLRIALDYLVFALARTDSKGVEQEGTQFLIEDGKGSVAKRWGFAYNAPRRLKGIIPAHQQLIEDLQPYNGGHWLRLIRDMSNPDKHRQFYDATTAGEFNISFSVSIPRLDRTNWYCRVFEATRPNGVLAKVYVYFDAPFEVLVNEDSGRKVPLKSILRELTTFTEKTLGDFQACVAGTCVH